MDSEEKNTHMDEQEEVVTDVSEKKPRDPKKFIVIAVLIAAALIFGAYSYFKGVPFLSYATVPDYMPAELQEKTLNTTVVVINDEEVDRSTYNNMLASVASVAVQQGTDLSNPEQVKAIKRDALDTLINNYLLQQASREQGIEVAEEDVDAQVAQVVMQLGGEEAYKKALDEIGVSEEKYRETITDQLRLNAYVEQVIPDEDLAVTDEEVQSYYDTAIGSAPEGAEIPSLSEAREQIVTMLKDQKKSELLKEHVDTLRESAEIEEKITI